MLLVQQLAQIPSLWWAGAALPLLALAWRRPIWLIGVFFLAGVVWAGWRAGIVLADDLAPELEGRNLVVVGHVADIPRATDYGLRFPFDVDSAELDGTPVQLPRHVLLASSVEGFVPRAGDAFALTVRLVRPHGFQNPGGFDYEGHLFRNRIRARGYVRLDTPPRRLEAALSRYAVDRLRQKLGEGIGHAVGDRPLGAMVLALANGDTGRMTPAQWETLRATGTVHLVAISGMHIGMIAGIVFLLARFLWALPGVTASWCPAPVAGAVAALLAASAYAALAGFTIPTQRALIMLAVVLGGVLWRRRFEPLPVLASALLAVLVYDPLSTMAAGFWLSFGAVALLVFFAADGERTGWQRLTYPQLAIAVGMLPMLLALFGRVSLVSPLANLIAIPVFSLVAVPFTLAGATLLPLSDTLAGGCFVIAAWTLEQLWIVLNWLANVPGAQWTRHDMPTWAYGCAAVGVLVLLAPRGFPARWIGAIWLLPLLAIRPAVPGQGELWFTLLDVGQGLAAVARTTNHTLVFDTGPKFSDSFDAGAGAVVPYLRARGIAVVDVLVISHGDNDHRGGAESVLRSVPVLQVLTGAAGLPFAAEACEAGKRWEWDGVEFEILHPALDTTVTRLNDRSCVLAVRSPYGSVLLPGDIEARAERELLARGVALAADVLVAPHHGSKTSSHDAFVAAVQPSAVLMPVGYRNRFRHPHPSVIERYRATGAAVHASPETGAIEYVFDARGRHVTLYRDARRRYWFTP